MHTVFVSMYCSLSVRAQPALHMLHVYACPFLCTV